MAHSHVVSDSDTHFIIDPMTRAIKKEESSKVSLIAGDHNSERFSFELPRYIEGHDMSLCNVIRVHYINTSSSNPQLQSVGVYEVDDFRIMESDDSTMEFSWLISNNATMHVGKLAFTVQFACMTGYKVEYSWQSGVYSAMSIADGIHGTQIVFEEYADILQQWWEKVYASSELPIKFYTVDEFAALGGETESGVLYLIEDDAHFADIDSLKTQSLEHETRIASNTAEIANVAQQVIGQQSWISNHETKIVDHENRISEREKRATIFETEVQNVSEIVNAYRGTIDNHSTLLNTHNAQITDHENRISSNETWISLSEKSITANANSIAELQGDVSYNTDWIDNIGSKLPDNSEEVQELVEGTSSFYKYTGYIPITTPDSTTTIRSGLWLFQVYDREVRKAASVIMDTACEVSSMFYYIDVLDGSTRYRPAVIERVSLTGDGMASFRVVILESNNTVSPIGYCIYGKPFGFKNPIG